MMWFFSALWLLLRFIFTCIFKQFDFDMPLYNFLHIWYLRFIWLLKSCGLCVHLISKSNLATSIFPSPPYHFLLGTWITCTLGHFGHLMWRTGSLEKDLDAGKDWRWEEKGTAEDEMIGWHYRLNGHEFEQAPGIGDGQGGLACCSPWGLKESDTTEQLNWYW